MGAAAVKIYQAERNINIAVGVAAVIADSALAQSPIDESFNDSLASFA